MNNFFLNYYKKLNRKEKILAAAFISVVFISIYMKVIYGPLSRGITEYRLQAKDLGNRLEEKGLKLPNEENKRENLAALVEEKEAYAKKLEEFKSKMPSRGSTSGLIGEFSRQAKGIELISLRQRIEAKEKQPHLFIEMKFEAPYKQSVNYINRLETISPLLKVTKAELSSPDKSGSQVISQLVFSIPLASSGTGAKFEAKEAEPLSFSEKNIFGLAKIEAKEEKANDFQLDGITFHFRKPTAIINGEVVAIDNKVDGFRVKEILPKSVILTDGQQDYSLVIKK